MNRAPHTGHEGTHRSGGDGMTQPTVHVLPDPAAVCNALARAFVRAVRETPATRPFRVALAGGATSEALYRLLADRYRSAVSWPRVSFFWSDERWVPPDDSASNHAAARRCLLDPLEIGREQVHPVPTWLADPAAGASAYERTLAEGVEDGTPPLDWVLLGLGEDGHTASLFPGALALAERQRWVLGIEDSPKPPPQRVTLTWPLIGRARAVHLLAVGASKQRAVEDGVAAATDLARYPTHGLRLGAAAAHWWLDDASAP